MNNENKILVPEQDPFFYAMQFIDNLEEFPRKIGDLLTYAKFV